MDEESDYETDCNASVRPFYTGGPKTPGTRSKKSPAYGELSLHSTKEVTRDPRRTVRTSAGGGDREYPAPIVYPPPIQQVPRSTFDIGYHYSCAEAPSITADGDVECDGHRQERSPVGSHGVAKMEQFVASGSPYKKAGKRKPRRTSAKYPEFISYDKRFESFQKDWPCGLPSPKTMAKAGFFFEGIRVIDNEIYTDRVRCFQCGNTLVAWKGDDDPVKEHRRVYPTQHCVDHLP